MKKIGEIIVSIYLGFARVIINITKDLFWKENINIQIQSIQSDNKRKKVKILVMQKGLKIIWDRKKNRNFTTVTE